MVLSLYADSDRSFLPANQGRSLVLLTSIPPGDGLFKHTYFSGINKRPQLSSYYGD
ncbi:hypothetical protein [Nostoc sp. LPT]|uniref:hypothetical protein n=1 Tax=Nostoc sp. LPT TaxID=2815387 RepID=UPI001DE12891|nr:hypothetical protein [Nostoc sp. LPT]MBN4001651.1 hypothetical protein [Nostoc sp. LPT]